MKNISSSTTITSSAEDNSSLGKRDCRESIISYNDIDTMEFSSIKSDLDEDESPLRMDIDDQFSNHSGDYNYRIPLDFEL